jgi:type I restriction enzyme S subunit
VSLHKQYPKYKLSNTGWLGSIPEHWGLLPLKAIALVELSNVDKKSTDGESEVRLCNYVDVYKNDRITQEINFMQATASLQQIQRLSLEVGDVLLTKDSESPDDIGVPALVSEPVSAVCGYHLALARPHPDLCDGGFLAWFIRCHPNKAYLETEAKGLTRYGIDKSSIKDMSLAYPPLAEQKKIRCFLDRETARIDLLITKKTRFIELLKEKRQAVITQAVTKGLDDSVPMKDSGVKWLGKVPAHWVVAPLKNFFISQDGRRIPLSSEERGGMHGEYPYYGASGIIDKINKYIFDEDLILVSEDGANLTYRSTPISFIACGKYWVNNHAHVLKPIDSCLIFWSERVESVDMVPYISGATQPKLTIESLMNIRISAPPTEEERMHIGNHIQRTARRIDLLVEKTTRSIDLLKEHRAALITAAVTGKIDVREVA